MNNLFAGSNVIFGGAVLVLLLGAGIGLVFKPGNAGAKVLVETFSEPLDAATSAVYDIHSDMGNLTIDPKMDNPQLLASGSLQYLEKQQPPTKVRESNGGVTSFTLTGKGTGRPGFRFPWDACGAATEWQIHLNPSVTSEIVTRSGGGTMKLDLTGMHVTRVSADSGGGNMDVILPENAAGIDVTAVTGGGNVTVDLGSGASGSNTITAKSGAGNVTVRVPAGIEVKIHAKSGMGKVIMDTRFEKMDQATYQSRDFENAADRVEITVESGAGNVIVTTK